MQWALVGLRVIALFLGTVHVIGMVWFVQFHPGWLFMPGVLLVIIGIWGPSKLGKWAGGFALACLLAMALIGLHIYGLMTKSIEEDVIGFFVAELVVICSFGGLMLKAKLAELGNML